MPARRLRPVGSSMNPGVKIGELALEILAIFLPCHAVDTGRRIPLQPRVGAVKKLDIDMVEERGEPFLPIQPCRCPYTLARLGVRRVLTRPVFSSAPSLGSAGSDLGRPTPFASFPATMEGSDFSPLCILGFGSSPRLPVLSVAAITKRSGPCRGWHRSPSGAANLTSSSGAMPRTFECVMQFIIGRASPSSTTPRAAAAMLLCANAATPTAGLSAASLIDCSPSPAPYWSGKHCLIPNSATPSKHKPDNPFVR